MTTPNRADLVRDAIWWDAVADQAKTRAQAARAVLAEQAAAEYEREGIAPTWRIPGLAAVPFGVTQPSVVVDDPAAYLWWITRRYPTEVETVTKVRDTFDLQLRRSVAERGDPPCTDDGEVIPGLRFVPGGVPRGIQLRPERDAKDHIGTIAGQWIDQHWQNGGGAK